MAHTAHIRTHKLPSITIIMDRDSGPDRKACIVTCDEPEEALREIVHGMMWRCSAERITKALHELADAVNADEPDNL